MELNLQKGVCVKVEVYSLGSSDWGKIVPLSVPDNRLMLKTDVMQNIIRLDQPPRMGSIDMGTTHKIQREYDQCNDMIYLANKAGLGREIA